MTQPLSDATISLTVKHVIKAPVTDVFNAWTTADSLAKWFAPSDQFTTQVTALDLQVGGQYRIQMTNAEGQVHTAIGEYLEIIDPHKLVFTWGWEGGDGGTVVRIDFKQQDGQTEITLTHDKFLSTEARDHHRQGWIGIFQQSDNYFSLPPTEDQP